MVGSWYLFSMGKSLFTGRLKIALVFAILTIAPLISESLPSNTPVNSNSPKVSGYLFLFIFSFDVCCVSRKFTTYSCFNLSPKWLLLRFILSVVLDRTVRFAATVDAVLEDYNSYLEQVIVKNRGGGGCPPPPLP